MKVERLIGIIILLLQRDQVTAPELAKRFEVSRRTISRDIENICKAGVPLVTTQGFGGGISIADSYKIDKALLSQEELQTILTGLKGIDSVSKISYLNRFVEKISSREKQAIVDDIIMIDLASHYQDALTQKIDQIKKAVRGRCIISFQYYARKGSCRRRIEPYRLVFKWSSWYVFGYCQDRNAYRLFKLNRLWDLITQDEVFFPRDISEGDMNFKSYFDADTIRLKAVFAESEKYRLIEEYGIECYITCTDGSLLFERNFASYENMREWIFSFGDKVQIVEPEELRADRMAQAENILKGDWGQPR